MKNISVCSSTYSFETVCGSTASSLSSALSVNPINYDHNRENQRHNQQRRQPNKVRKDLRNVRNNTRNNSQRNHSLRNNSQRNTKSQRNESQKNESQRNTTSQSNESPKKKVTRMSRMIYTIEQCSAFKIDQCSPFETKISDDKSKLNHQSSSSSESDIVEEDSSSSADRVSLGEQSFNTFDSTTREQKYDERAENELEDICIGQVLPISLAFLLCCACI